MNRSSVTRLAADKLRAAVLPDGSIDAAHPVVAAWARERGVKPATLLSRLARSDDAPTGLAPVAPPTPRKPTARRPKPPEPPQDAAPTGPGSDAQAPAETEPLSGANVESYMDMSMRQIAAQFGNLRNYAEEVDALKKSVDARRIELQNQESEGELIGRDFVRGHVFSWLDALARKLLSDAAKTGTKRVYSMAKSGASIEQAEATLREVLGAHLKTAKSQIVKALRGLE